jgi:hypothetical protein
MHNLFVPAQLPDKLAAGCVPQANDIRSIAAAR